MRRRAALLAPFAVAAILYGCALHPSSGPAESQAQVEAGTRSEAPEIVGGDPINSNGDPIAHIFSRSTVVLNTPVPDGGGYQRVCTGVIVSNDQILTAAHCEADETTQVGFYGTLSAQPIQWISGDSDAVTPPGLNCPAELPLNDAGGQNDRGCYVNGILMDLAILRLSQNIPAGYRAADLGSCGDYAANYQKGTWEVGAGRINGAQNWNNQMNWVAMTLPPTDTNGEIDTTRWYGDLGDSGGPVFQIDAPSSDAGVDAGGPLWDGGPAGNLAIVGISHARLGTPDAGPVTNNYTSVEYSTTCLWLLSQIGYEPPIIIAGDRPHVLDLPFLQGDAPHEPPTQERPVSPLFGK